METKLTGGLDQWAFRPWRESDRQSLAKHINNIRIWDNMRDGLPHPYSLKDAEEFIALSSRCIPMCNYAITYDGQAVGGIGIVPDHDVERVSAEIGYWLGEEFWNRGVMGRMIKEFSKYIFANTEIIHLYAGIFGFNEASMRVIEKGGFTKVGVMHSCAVKNGKVIDLHYFEKLKE